MMWPLSFPCKKSDKYWRNSNGFIVVGMDVLSQWLFRKLAGYAIFLNTISSSIGRIAHKKFLVRTYLDSFYNVKERWNFGNNFVKLFLIALFRHREKWPFLMLLYSIEIGCNSRYLFLFVAPPTLPSTATAPPPPSFTTYQRPLR